MQKTQIQHNFNQASKTYDTVSHVQKTCAEQLVSLVQQHFPDFYPDSILDIGTGTGHLPTALLNRFPHSHYFLNDFSKEMLKTAQKKFSHLANFSFLQADMDALPPTSHALIISNFALQWTTQLTYLLRQLYIHSNLLAFSCLLQGTFEEWRALFIEQGLPSPIYPYPTEQSLTQILQSLKAQHCYITTQDFMLHFDNPRQFILYLQQLGANTSQSRIKTTHLKTLLTRSTHPFTTRYKVCFALVGDL